MSFDHEREYAFQKFREEWYGKIFERAGEIVYAEEVERDKGEEEVRYLVMMFAMELLQGVGISMRTSLMKQEFTKALKETTGS